MLSFWENHAFAFWQQRQTDRQTNKQTEKPIALSRSRCRERRLNKWNVYIHNLYWHQIFWSNLSKSNGNDHYGEKTMSEKCKFYNWINQHIVWSLVDMYDYVFHVMTHLAGPVRISSTTFVVINGSHLSGDVDDCCTWAAETAVTCWIWRCFLQQRQKSLAVKSSARIRIPTQFQQEVKVIWQKAPHGGPIPRLGVTPGGRKLYHWIPGVGFPISVP